MPVTRSRTASNNPGPWAVNSGNASPLVTPDDPNFPPIGSAKKPERTRTPSNAARSSSKPPAPTPPPVPPKPALRIQTVQPNITYASLLGGSCEPSPIGSRSREPSANTNEGRSREPSANAGRSREPSNNNACVQDLRRMLEEMRTSPQPTPSPTKSEFDRPLSPAPPMQLCVSAPANMDGRRSGTWTPSEPYVPPGRQSQLRAASPIDSSVANPSPITSNRDDPSPSIVIPTVSINDEELPSNDQQPDESGPDGREGETKSMWERIHEAVEAIEKLEGPNWPSWSFWLHRKVTAVSKDIWGHIDGSSPRPDPDYVAKPEDSDTDVLDEWDMNEAAIYCALFASLDFKIVHAQVRACTTAKDVWDRLEMLYREKPTPESCAVDLIRELSQAVYFEGEDLQRHLYRFIEITDELNCGPYPMSLALSKRFILDSLPGCLLKHTSVLRAQTHATVQELCLDILQIGEQVLGDKCVEKPENPPPPTQRQISASLPYDLRHYKYTGSGALPDGGLFTRGRHTCAACLAIGHKAYSPKCPQTEVRLGLWGYRKDPLKVENERGQGKMGSTWQSRGKSVFGQDHGQGQFVGCLSGWVAPGSTIGTRRFGDGWNDKAGSVKSGRSTGYSTPATMSKALSRGSEADGKVGIVSSRPSALDIRSWR